MSRVTSETGLRSPVLEQVPVQYFEDLEEIFNSEKYSLKFPNSTAYKYS
jgi:hypothetical protein